MSIVSTGSGNSVEPVTIDVPVETSDLPTDAAGTIDHQPIQPNQGQIGTIDHQPIQPNQGQIGTIDHQPIQPNQGQIGTIDHQPIQPNQGQIGTIDHQPIQPNQGQIGTIDISPESIIAQVTEEFIAIELDTLLATNREGLQQIVETASGQLEVNLRTNTSIVRTKALENITNDAEIANTWNQIFETDTMDREVAMEIYPNGRVVYRLGKSNSSVFLIYTGNPGEPLQVVKCLNVAEDTKDEVEKHKLERFNREPLFLKRLSGRANVPTFRGDGTHISSKKPFYLSEYIPGRTFDALLKEGAIESGQQTANIMFLTALGLHDIHQEGVIHRDVKPANTLIGDDGRVYLIDFDLAKDTRAGTETIDEVDNVDEQTKTGAILGTPHYLAPEQTKNAKDVTESADVYPLGMMLYHAEIGAPPYTEGAAMEILMRHHTEEPDLSMFKNERVKGVIQQLIEKDPSKRPNALQAARLLWEHTSFAKQYKTMDEYLEQVPREKRRLPVDTPKNEQEEKTVIPSRFESAADQKNALETACNSPQLQELRETRRQQIWSMLLRISKISAIGTVCAGALSIPGSDAKTSTLMHMQNPRPLVSNSINGSKQKTKEVDHGPPRFHIEKNEEGLPIKITLLPNTEREVSWNFEEGIHGQNLDQWYASVFPGSAEKAQKLFGVSNEELPKPLQKGGAMEEKNPIIVFHYEGQTYICINSGGFCYINEHDQLRFFSHKENLCRNMDPFSIGVGSSPNQDIKCKEMDIGFRENLPSSVTRVVFGKNVSPAMFEMAKEIRGNMPPELFFKEYINGTQSDHFGSAIQVGKN